MKRTLYGKITISIEDKVIYEVNILAKNSIRKKEVKDYVVELSKQLFKNNLQIWLEQEK